MKRARGDRICIWTRSDTPKISILNVGVRALLAMNFTSEERLRNVNMEFSFHHQGESGGGKHGGSRATTPLAGEVQLTDKGVREVLFPKDGERSLHLLAT